ncbi:MAG: 4Fe-4S dicluster domain-containing protein [Chloroflexota bacterium]
MATIHRSAEIIRPDFGFLKAVQRRSGQPIAGCYRCLQCSAGCPMAEAMDYPPDRLIRMIQLGLKEEALESRAIWLCTSCLTCADRCPNGIDVPAVVDVLRQMATVEGYRVGDPRVAAFHQGFLSVVRRYGRLHEATLIALLKLKSHDWLADVGSGLRLFLKGKIPVLPQPVRGGDQLAGLFRQTGADGSPPGGREGTG